MQPHPDPTVDRQIATASTRALKDRAEAIFAMPNPSEAEQLEAEVICDELAERQHDLEDPSSGLGCHLPS